MKRKKEKAEAEEEKISVGLDIGTTKVVAFVGRKSGNNGKIEILGQGETVSVGVQRGQVINITKTVIAINHAIKQACATSAVEIDTVVVGIAGQHIATFHSTEEIKRKNPNTVVTSGDVKQLIDEVFMLTVQPGRQIIDVIPQEFFVDNYNDLKDPIGVAGTQLGSKFNIITGNEQHIKNVLRCVNQCDLKMEGLILEPLASATVVLDEKEKEAGVALVDIGGGTTDIAVFYDGILRHTAVIPIGGDVITDDIKYVFKGIVKEDAERIKVEHGSCISDTSKANLVISIPGIRGRDAIEVKQTELSDVIAARMEEIVQRIMSELEESGYLKHLGCGIVLTGGGSLLSGVKEYTEFLTGLSTRMGSPEENIIFNEDTRHKYDSPIYSTALGLMVMGLEKDDENLEGMDYENSSKNQEKQNSINPWHPWQKMKDFFKTLGDVLIVEEKENDEYK